MDNCLSLPFDQYQRYKLVSDIINKFRTGNKKFRILDVGAGFEEILKKFLTLDDIFCLDKEYPPVYSPKRNFIVGDIISMEFKEQYDFVVAVDVYEHISQNDRKKFIDIIIPLSEIATIIAAPFDQDEVRRCEFFANEVYRNSHGSDYTWLKEHIKNGLPTLPYTLDLIKFHHLDSVTIPNGYLPRWFEMISTYLLTEGQPEFQPMMTTLSELYNHDYYHYDNRAPAYRQIIIIPKGDWNIDFSDLAAKNVHPDDIYDKDQLLGSFIDKIKQSYLIYQINKETQNQAIAVKDARIQEMVTCIKMLEQEGITKDEQILEITTKLANLKHTLASKDNYIQEIFDQVTNLNQLLAYKDEQLEDLSFSIANLNQTPAIKDDQIYSDDQIINAKKIQIDEIYPRMITLESEITQIKNSISYQLTMKFHQAIIERFFPQNTKMREYYDLGIKSGRLLINEGFGKLYWSHNERNRLKKIETGVLEQECKKKSQQLINYYKNSSLDQIKILEPQEEIETSIIIPIYNQLTITKNCLHSISKNTCGNYEVIIVDDASTDETVSQLKNIKNLSLIRNNENLGFIESCNKGAKSSHGKYLLFLNNDTIVTENWLPPLLDLIKKEDVGAVGSKLIHPNGMLQEAGGIIWNDASGTNYGRGDNPEKPEYNFVRNVDYCSGAALLVKMDIFERIGGFDKHFAPAYYEDADLCFSIRKLGYRVLYQPMSVVIHFEGVSNGRNIAEGVKQNQVVNKEKFFNKWKDILQMIHFMPDSRNLFAARSRSSGKQILVIDQHIPFFDRDAGSYRMFNILKILVELGHNVTFIGNNFNQFEPYDTIMQQFGVDVIYSPYITSIGQYLSKYGENFNIVIVSRPDIAKKQIVNIRKYCIHAKVIYDTVDLAFLRESRMAEVKKDPQRQVNANEIKKIELQLAKMCDVTLVVSTHEKQILNNEDPFLNVQVISLIHTIILPTKKYSERRDILFLGAFLHTPNADGVLWFINYIFPKIKNLKPGIRIFIVGDRPTNEILSLSSDDIIVTGYVEDLSEYFNNCRVFVAPLRFGAGVKGKINQSMSHGLPVVTTSIGAEGMGIIDGENVLIADDPELFSQKVIRLYNDENLWNTISNNSIEHIRQNTSYEQGKIRIKQFIESL